MRSPGITSPSTNEEERQFEAALRPTRLADFAGQPHAREQLEIAIQAARLRGEAMDHVLLCGPPGLGKTTLAGIIAQELGVPLDQTAGPVLQKKFDLSGVLTNVRAKQVFFIDEIHRLLPDIEEILYAALEDYRLDILIGTGPGARTHSIALPRFTAVGATTRQARLSAPLRGRFGIVLRLDPYDEQTLGQIVGAFGQASENRRYARSCDGNRPPRPRDSSHCQSPAAPGERLRPGARQRFCRPRCCSGGARSIEGRPVRT